MMKLARRILALHLIGMVVACAVALQTDRDATRLMAFGLFMLIAGWLSVIASAAFMVLGSIKRKVWLSDLAFLLVALLLAWTEKSHGAELVGYLRSLPG